jgi:diadenosine tetraphosphatase ApaH/serine/threonine PP2A family protein phosphatase
MAFILHIRYVQRYLQETGRGLKEMTHHLVHTRINRPREHGPFDIIGDVHGCIDELRKLLELLGYEDQGLKPPEGRKLVFLGDLVDRGPDSPGVLRVVMNLVQAGCALCVPGNHDNRLLRTLRGRNTQQTHGLAETLEQLHREPPTFITAVEAFLASLPSHYLLDGGRLVVAHAGMPRHLQGRDTPRARDFALYGATTGELDEYGMPIRGNWAADYHGRAVVVYGHTPLAEPIWLNRTINIDTGCVFGGRLTALRYPERELVSVPAHTAYARPGRPFLPTHTVEQ